LAFHRHEDDKDVMIGLRGAAAGSRVDLVAPAISHALEQRKLIVFDLSCTDDIDGHFLGLLLVLSKELGKRDQPLVIADASPRLRRIFRLNRFEFLLADS
jgi:N-acetylglucosaminyldiphosphoundecaprenol N-acetyl-beta-D-mannosaminyltransferase